LTVRIALTAVTIGMAACNVLSHDLAGLAQEYRSRQEDSESIRNQLQYKASVVPNSLSLLTQAGQREALQIIGNPSDSTSLAAAIVKRHPGALAIIRDKLKWNPGTSITVCFSTLGNREVKQSVANITAEWERYGNVRFDFGQEPNYRQCAPRDGVKIRVNLLAAGNSSLVGIEAEGKDLSNQNTMFFAEVDTATPKTARFRWLVLHEFGHALGLVHEHQHPHRTCMAQLNGDVVQKEFGWNDTEYVIAMQRLDISSVRESSGFFYTGVLSGKERVTHTTYDSDSVMNYDLKRTYFNTDPPGSCYHDAVRTEPSAYDKAIIQRAYPYIATQGYVRRHNDLLDRVIRDTAILTMPERQALQTLRRNE
jgi:hypothetical protein